MENQYHSLTHYVLPQPFPILIAILLNFGIVFLTQLLLKRIFKKDVDWIRLAAGYISVIAILSWLMFLISTLKIAYIHLIRIQSLMLMALSLPLIFSIKKKLLKKKFYIPKLELKYKLAFVLSLFIFWGILLKAFTAPTDIDSLHYHLGVPVDILNNHGLAERFDWFVFRLTGYGEYINVLGIAAGTDLLIPVIQTSGFLFFILAITGMFTSSKQKIFVMTMILGAPLITYVIPISKLQILPAIATTLALILFYNLRSLSDFSSFQMGRNREYLQ
jgi:hypothetical protein